MGADLRFCFTDIEILEYIAVNIDDRIFDDHIKKVYIEDMRIDGVSSYLNNDSFQYATGRTPASAQQNKNSYNPGVIVEISPQAREYQEKIQLDKKIKEAAEDMQGCQTCKNRKYVDGSNDPSVSFQTPQNIDPNQAASRVRAHEHEHVANEQEKAQKENRKVVSQTVSLSTSICPECNRVYVSGGVTHTITKNDQNPESQGEPS